MDRLMQLVLLCVLVGVNSAEETLTTSFEGKAETVLQLNPEEDIQIQCLINSDPLTIAHVLKWYKEQSVNDWVGVTLNEEELEPFDNQNSPNKYKAVIDVNIENARETFYYLRITGVEKSDAGKYRCSSGISEDALQHSDPVELIIIPEKIDPVISTEARVENEVYNFNMTEKLSCKAEAETTTPNLKLVMSLGQESIEPEFQGTQVMDWTGPDGLKTPLTTVEVIRNSWQPENYGQFVVTCEFLDGERLLGSSSITVSKEEPVPVAEIDCVSNYGKRRAKRGDGELMIICTASNTEGIKDLTVTYEFFNNEKSVTLKTGEIKFGRLAKVDRDNSQKFIMSIARVDWEVVAPGQNVYNVTLYGDGAELYTTEYILPVDATYRSSRENGSSGFSPMTILMLICTVVAAYTNCIIYQ